MLLPITVPDHATMVANIMSVYSEATHEETVQGIYWYRAANTFASGLSAKYGVSLEQAAAIIAVLSPRVSWEKNLTYADHLCSGYIPLFLTARCELDRILDGDLNAVSGHKVKALFANILHPNTGDEVTIDRRTFNVACKDTGTNFSRKGLERAGAYEAVSDAYRQAAKRVWLSPCQVQAITWVTWKRMKAEH